MKNQLVEIKIDYVGRRGDGVGDWQGKPVFVPRALPGEIARVRLEEDRDKGFAGRLMELVTPSPERIAAPCPWYERCGGCSLQHWRPESYRSWKTERVPQLLARAGIAVGEWRPPVFIPDRTRRRATFAAVVQNKTLRLGYHRARSHDITDIPDCLLLTPRLQTAVNALRPHLAKILTPNRPADIFVQDTGSALEVMITGLLGSGKQLGLAEREAMGEIAQAANLARLSWRARERDDEPEIILQAAPVAKKCGALTVELPPGAFMQPSVEGEAALLRAALDPVREAGAKKIADLFSGCGTFSGPLLALGSVRAVESDAAPVAALKKAAKNTALTAEERNLFADPLTEKELNNFDAILFDPPRMGAKEQAAQLARSNVPLVIGISCSASTFVRDAGLLSAGGYKLASMQVIDQFVWSSHMELVGVFRR